MSKGFTLVEMVVAIAIFVTIISTVSAFMINVMTNPQYQLSAMNAVDMARLISTNFTNEIRGAVPGSDGSFCLNGAGDSEIIFFTKYNSPAGLPLRVRYFISDGKFYKGVTTPSGSPLAYDLNLETVIPLLDISNEETPIFLYYTGAYDGFTGSPLSQPVSASAIRFIKISLTVPVRLSQTSTSNVSVTAGAAIRSLKDNL